MRQCLCDMFECDWLSEYVYHSCIQERVQCTTRSYSMYTFVRVIIRIPCIIYPHVMSVLLFIGITLSVCVCVCAMQCNAMHVYCCCQAAISAPTPVLRFFVIVYKFNIRLQLLCHIQIGISVILLFRIRMYIFNWFLRIYIRDILT